MNRNRQKDIWTCFNDKQHANDSVLLLLWHYFVCFADNPLDFGYYS